MVFNDLQLNREAKQEAPYRTQQQIRTEVEYQNYFSQQNAQIGSFETMSQLELTRSQRDLAARQNNNTQQTLQADKSQQTQEHEVAVQIRDANAALRQQENSDNISAWKDAKDYQDQTTAKAADSRQEYELKSLQKLSKT
jgi:hypothetical protein